MCVISVLYPAAKLYSALFIVLFSPPIIAELIEGPIMELLSHHHINDLDAHVPMRFPDHPIIHASLVPSMLFRVPHPMMSNALPSYHLISEFQFMYIRLPRHPTIADHSPFVIFPYPQIVVANEPLALLL